MKNLLADSKIFFILIAFSGLIFFLDFLNLLFYPKLAIQTVILPIQYGFSQVGKSLDSQVQFLFNARYAALENKALRAQLSQLVTENALLSKKLKESEILIDQPNKLDPQIFNLIPARVVSSGRSLVIDKGSSDGVVEGQAVVYQSNYLGTVSKSNPKSAVVLLPFDPNSKVAVFSQNTQGRARGILLGQFGSDLLMDKILHQEPVEVGDIIYSEGTEGKLPRGLILGKVDQVLENPNEVFKQAKVKSVVNFNDLDVVFIMKGQ